MYLLTLWQVQLYCLKMLLMSVAFKRLYYIIYCKKIEDASEISRQYAEWEKGYGCDNECHSFYFHEEQCFL